MKNKITVITLSLTLAVLTALAWFLPKAEFDESERRVLAAAPELSVENIFSGGYAAQFEEYSTDTFPFRGTFRSIKAYASDYAFNLSDNNKVISKDGHLSKIEYPMSTEMLDFAAEKFKFIYDAYLKDANTRVFLSIVPDKNYFIDTLKFDYDAFCAYMREGVPFAEYIDIFPYLELSDFYNTDSHWRQEKLGDVAGALASGMGASVNARYEVNTLDTPFYGVYVGQAARRVRPDTIKYLTSETLSGAIVTNYDTGMPKKSAVYDFEKAAGRDTYEFFLSGNSALITLENPAQTNGKHLVMFRDSYAGALAPLLCEGYSKITLVDIRYVNPAMLGSLVDFEDSDVLFMYSTTLLNQSSAFK